VWDGVDVRRTCREGVSYRSACGDSPLAGDWERTLLAKGSNVGRRFAKVSHETGVGWHAVPRIEEFYGILRLATATTPNMVKAIEKRPSRAAA